MKSTWIETALLQLRSSNIVRFWSECPLFLMHQNTNVLHCPSMFTGQNTHTHQLLYDLTKPHALSEHVEIVQIIRWKIMQHLHDAQVHDVVGKLLPRVLCKRDQKGNLSVYNSDNLLMFVNMWYLSSFIQFIHLQYHSSTVAFHQVTVWNFALFEFRGPWPLRVLGDRLVAWISATRSHKSSALGGICGRPSGAAPGAWTSDSQGCSRGNECCRSGWRPHLEIEIGWNWMKLAWMASCLVVAQTFSHVPSTSRRQNEKCDHSISQHATGRTWNSPRFPAQTKCWQNLP